MKRNTVVFGASAIFVFALGIGAWSWFRAGPAEPVPAASVETSYPDEWRMTLAEARNSAAFPLVVPSHPAANEQNLTAVYVHPGGTTVAMQFPAPKSSNVRQDYIEVFLLPWEGGNPAERFAQDIAQDPVIGKSLLSVEGVPAEGTLANSPSDIEQANPAYLRLVHKGLEIQISGGDSLDLLLKIAQTMVA